MVARLRDEDHDIAYVPEASAGIRDDEVLARANAEGRVLLTEDKDFGDLAFFYGNRSSGIVLLRAHGAEGRSGRRGSRDARGRAHKGPTAFRCASVGQAAEVPINARSRDRRIGKPRVGFAFQDEAVDIT